MNPNQNPNNQIVDVAHADIEQAAWAASQPKVTSVRAELLYAFLESRGIDPELVFALDEDYSLPDPEWVSGSFADSWAKFINGLGFKFTDESSDCDDYAAGARWWAQYLQSRTRPGDSALALFECAYIPESGVGHAICGCVSRKDGKLVLSFFEPQPTQAVNGIAMQTMKPVELTPCEIKSICYLRF